MADYPNAIYSPRTKSNKVGVVYDPDQATKLYAEDIVNDDNEIVAIETELGENPKGSFDSVALFLQSLLSSVATIVTDFLGLSDTPSSYSGQSGKAVLVNATEDGLEFGDVASDLTKATGAEINTGTNDDHYVTPKSIADSDVAFLSDIPSVPVKATGAEINTGTDDAKFATAKAIADSNVAFLSDIPSVPVKATGAEINTGTDDAKFATAKAIADSNLAFLSDILAAIGGLNGITTGNLSGNITLTALTDKMIQSRSPNGANRNVTLATSGVSAGSMFIIRNSAAASTAFYLQVRQSSTTLDRVYPGCVKSFIFDGTNWLGLSLGTGENGTFGDNIALGTLALAIGNSIAIGKNVITEANCLALGESAQTYDNSIALGKSSDGRQHSVSLGISSLAYNYSTAIGELSNANNFLYSCALGYYSKVFRHGEFTRNISGHSDSRSDYGTLGFYLSTTNATPTEMPLTGNTGFRATIRANSTFAFTGIVVARDTASTDCAMYKIEGIIRRDGSNNTDMPVAATVTVVHESVAGWDLGVTADDTNEALKLTVTGATSKTIRWSGRVDFVEVTN